MDTPRTHLDGSPYLLAPGNSVGWSLWHGPEPLQEALVHDRTDEVLRGADQKRIAQKPHAREVRKVYLGESDKPYYLTMFRELVTPEMVKSDSLEASGLARRVINIVYGALHEEHPGTQVPKEYQEQLRGGMLEQLNRVWNLPANAKEMEHVLISTLVPLPLTGTGEMLTLIETPETRLKDIPKPTTLPSAPTSSVAETMAESARLSSWGFGTVAAVGLGVIALGGGLFYLLKRPQQKKHQPTPNPDAPWTERLGTAEASGTSTTMQR